MCRYFKIERWIIGPRLAAVQNVGGFCCVSKCVVGDLKRIMYMHSCVLPLP